MRRLLLCTVVLLCSLAAVAQQDYVGRFDAYGGWGYLNSTNENLVQHGFHTQEGVNLNKWLSFGFDFSKLAGSTSLVANQMSTKYQDQLTAAMPSIIAGLVQAGEITPAQVPAALQAASTLYVPYNASTYTITGGPQLSYRGLKWITFFVHPSVGAYHEEVTARPGKITDPVRLAVTSGVVSAFQSAGVLDSNAKKSDTTYFYGIGGGIELNVTKHVHIRMTSDWVKTPLFDGFLKDTVNNVRFSVGPTFTFGKNVANKKGF